MCEINVSLHEWISKLFESFMLIKNYIKNYPQASTKVCTFVEFYITVFLISTSTGGSF